MSNFVITQFPIYDVIFSLLVTVGLCVIYRTSVINGLPFLTPSELCYFSAFELAY